MADQQWMFDLPDSAAAEADNAAPARQAIHQGDCLQWLQRLTPGSVDLVFADPPFNIGYEYDVYDDQRQTEDYLGWCRGWIEGVHRGLKDDGTFWLAIGDEYAAELKVIAQETGFHCRSWVIWYYTFGVNCVRGFSRSHTHLFHFVKDPQHFTFNAINPHNRVPSARQLVYGDARANPKGRLPDNTWIYRPQDAPDSFQPEHDTWYYARVAGTFKERQGFHGCQMPEQLLGRIIRVSSQPQDLVLDPFSGSGTTVCVAKKLGRQWMGFELSPEYVAATEERLATIRPGDSLDGPEDPLRSAPRTSVGRRRRLDPAEQAQLQQDLKQVFAEVAQGKSLDEIRCSPADSQQLFKACRQAGLKGYPRQWAAMLRQLRDDKQLPGSGALPVPAGGAPEDPILDPRSPGVEVAMRLIELDFGVDWDQTLDEPDYAQEFDRLASEYAPPASPSTHRQLAQRMARAVPVNEVSAELTEQSSWGTDPDTIPAVSGVFLVVGDQGPLLAGATSDLRTTVGDLQSSEAWNQLQPKELRWHATSQASPQDLAAWRAFLVRDQKPMLNRRREPESTAG